MKGTTLSKILIWDLETAGVNSFKADLAKIVCFGHKWLGEKEVYCKTIDEFPGWFTKKRGLNDKPLIEYTLAVMEEADLLVAHYGDRFDRRFFQGRVAIHGLKPPPPTKQRDTWRIARGALGLSSNRLDAIAMALGLKERKYQKTRDEWPGWWHRALAGDAEGIHEMAKYCKQDVVVTEEIYKRLRPYDNLNHPNLHAFGDKRADCGMCGGKVQYHGQAYVGQNRYRRYQCTECGRWGRENKKIT